MNRFAALLLCSLAFRPAAAAAPAEVDFQGRLSDPQTHNPVAGPNASVTFRIFDALSGGTQVWAEGPRTLAVDNGAFEARLGEVAPLSASDFTGPRWLEVEADGETLTPRQPLSAVPFALRAAVADALDAGSTNYIQNGASLQSGAQVHAASGSLAGTLTVYGLIRAAGDARVTGLLRVGPAASAVTTAGGSWDASALDPATLLPNASLDSSSVTKRGNKVDGPDGLLRLDGSAYVPAARLDPGDVTQKGNSFNGASQLLQLSAGALVPNAQLDASSAVKRSPAGPVHSYQLDSASITLQGNSFNAAGKPLLLDGAGLVPNAMLDASSVVKRAADGFVQDYHLDPSSVTLQANTFNAANRLAKLDSGAGLTVGASGAAVYSVVTSSSVNMAGAGAKAREQGADLVPKGAVIIWPEAACPTGWSEATEFRGVVPLGACAGCTVGLQVGVAFTANAQEMSHNHSAGAVDGSSYRTGGTSLTDTRTTTMPYRQLLFCRRDG